MRYSLSNEAADDLEHIYIEGILGFGEAQALKYRHSLERLFGMLADMPTLGRRSERGHEGERRFPMGVHVIYYRETGEGIEIMRLIAGRQILDIWGNEGGS